MKEDYQKNLSRRKLLWLVRSYTLPSLVSSFVNVRNVIEMRRLNNQFVDVATLLHELLAHIGYISELIVHGIGPIPTRP